MVPELGGTTTVVDFCGGGGLLLLIQADRPTSIQTEARTIFIVAIPSGMYVTDGEYGHTLTSLRAVASRPCTAPAVGVILRGRDREEGKPKEYW